MKKYIAVINESTKKGFDIVSLNHFNSGKRAFNKVPHYEEEMYQSLYKLGCEMLEDNYFELADTYIEDELTQEMLEERLSPLPFFKVISNKEYNNEQFKIDPKTMKGYIDKSVKVKEKPVYTDEIYVFSNQRELWDFFVRNDYLKCRYSVCQMDDGKYRFILVEECKKHPDLFNSLDEVREYVAEQIKLKNAQTNTPADEDENNL